MLPPITDADMEQARALARTHAQLKATLTQLRVQEDRTRRYAQEYNTALWKRCDFQRHPALLAGVAELAQAQHPYFKVIVPLAYRSFLRTLINPLKPFTRMDEPALPTPPPRALDFDAIPREARPALLGAYLGIHQRNRLAELDLEQSRPSEGRIVMLQTGGPVNIEEWRAHLPAANAWLTAGTKGVTWTITQHTASRVELTRQPELPAMIPYDRHHLKTGALFVGIDTLTRKPAYIPFADLTAGTYIPGASGSGKTSALHVLLRSIFANLDLFAQVYLVDGKDGVALARYANLHPKVRVLYDEPDVWQLAADLSQLMRDRNVQQRAAGIDKATRDLIAVVVDELPTFVVKPPGDAKKDHAAFLDNLNRLAMRGRSAGIKMFFITQSPVAEQIPVTLRVNCATTIAFRVPEVAHATALFGTLTPENDPRKLPTGQARVLLGDTGKLITVQFPFAELYQPRNNY